MQENQGNTTPDHRPVLWPRTIPPPTIDFALMSAACQSFVQRFPEFGFIHQPTFFQDLQSGLVTPLKSAAILALCSGNKDFAQHEDIVDRCADFARQNIIAKVLDRPDADTVQTLIILSLYEWGNGRGFQSWMYLGMAIRMGEALISVPALSDGEQTFMSREITCRTLWACFIMDCILSGGKGRKESFRSETVPFPLPISDDEFAFQIQPEGTRKLLSRHAYQSSLAPTADTGLDNLGSQHYLSIIIQGFDISSAVTNWINGGGRREEPNDASAYPWNESSKWNRMMSALRHWRSGLSPHWLYSRSNNNMRAFALRNQAPSFAMVNLLYYVTVIFLHREYTPFLPHRVERPQGPIDPPLLPNTHPQGWWANSAQSLFDAAVSIVDTVQGLESNGVKMRTPLMGFWMYTAAFTLQYGCSWPHMAQESMEMQSKYEWAMSWLREVNQEWKICNGWIKTIGSLQLLYDGIKQDVSRYLTVGRDSFVELEDNVQRLAEVETSPSASGEPAHILVALSQSGLVPPRQPNTHSPQDRIDTAEQDSGWLPLNSQPVPGARNDLGYSALQEIHDPAYSHQTTDNMDEQRI
ncbi:hypothetical protein SUNI508_10225 [Seiridium unicorne]|uniref:Xylanolytic transcriptional activator regulatory domain-containing protein n=1 Tax=Seiridium unicorne TaxID=138068 RepID=A0ABR2UM82_9PEZI